MRFTSTASGLVLLGAASACPYRTVGRGNGTYTTSGTPPATVRPTVIPTFVSLPASSSAHAIPTSFTLSVPSSFATSVSSSFASSVPASSVSAVPSSVPTGGSSIPVGQVIYSCTVPGTIALTFDDGPYNYTMKALDLLGDAGMRATFFVNGDNYSKITERGPEVARILAEGHQLGSHTWSHPYLSQLDDAAVREQMIKLEDTLVEMTGKSPTYMRPPYFDYNDNTLAALKALGYHVIQTDVDTNDWANQTPETYNKSVDNFRNGLDAGGRLVLAHDVHETTIDLLLPDMIKIVEERGLKAVPVGECLGDPSTNWYRAPRTTAPPPTEFPSGTPTNGTATSTAAPTPTGVEPTGVVGPGGACGGDEKYICMTGNCCSQYGYCGTTDQYCGTGCQSAFGLCY